MHMHMHGMCICTCTWTRWEVTRETRQSGNSEGTTDLYYHSGTPRAAGVKRFRSRAEVARHLGLAGPSTHYKKQPAAGGTPSHSAGQGGWVLVAPARESGAAVIARSPELQRMRQMALEQQRQLRDHHAAQVTQLMAQATQAAQAQAAQGLQGPALQLVTHGVGPHAFVATHGVHATVVAAQQVHAQQMQQLHSLRPTHPHTLYEADVTATPLTTPLQAYAQQMAQLVARQEQQIAAACRRALLPCTPTAIAHGTYGCIPYGVYGYT